MTDLIERDPGTDAKISRPLTGSEQTTYDDFNTPAAFTARLSTKRDEDTDQMFVVDPMLKAFALVVLDEINLLRTQHALPLRTATQLRDAVRAKMDV